MRLQKRVSDKILVQLRIDFGVQEVEARFRLLTELLCLLVDVSLELLIPPFLNLCGADRPRASSHLNLLLHLVLGHHKQTNNRLTGVDVAEGVSSRSEVL